MKVFSWKCYQSYKRSILNWMIRKFPKFQEITCIYEKKTLVQIVACLDFTDGFENKNLLSFFSCISHVHFIAYITLKRPSLSTFIANFRSCFFGCYFIYIPTNYFNSFMSQLMTKFFADTMACSCDNSNFTLKVR